MNRKALSIAASALALASAAPAMAQSASTAASVPWDLSTGRLYVFGDSLSDTGNTGPAYLNGRYSNGPVWWESVVSGSLAIDPFLTGPVGSTANGINFAHGGARTAGFLVAPGVTLPGTIEQTAAYASLVSSHAITGPTVNDTFSIWIGGNNFLSALGSGGTPNIAQGLADVQTSVNTLAAAGAHRFILMSLPALGTVIASVPSASKAGVDYLAHQYDAGLMAIDQGLTAHGATVMYVNVEAATLDIFNNPSVYGYSQLTANCLGSGLVLAACPSSYFSYDGVHPTAKGHQIIAQLVMATEANLDYGASTYAQVLNTGYQLHRDTLDLLGSNALAASGSRLSLYGFVRYNNGHDNAQGFAQRANYSGESFGMGARVPVGDKLSFGVSGALFTGNTSVGGPVGGGGSLSSGDISANAIYRSGNSYAMLLAGAGQYKLNLTRATAFSWRPTATATVPIDDYFVSMEGGAKLAVGKATVTPYAQMAFTSFTLGHTLETAPLLAAEVSQASLKSWQLTGGLKVEVPVSASMKLGLNGAISDELSGNTQLAALYNNVDYSYANLHLGGGVEGKAGVNLSGEICKGVGVNVELGGRTGKYARDAYGQATISVPF